MCWTPATWPGSPRPETFTLRVYGGGHYLRHADARPVAAQAMTGPICNGCPGLRQAGGLSGSVRPTETLRAVRTSDHMIRESVAHQDRSCPIGQDCSWFAESSGAIASRSPPENSGVSGVTGIGDSVIGAPGLARPGTAVTGSPLAVQGPLHVRKRARSNPAACRYAGHAEPSRCGTAPRRDTGACD
jgi:hypothetical protein